MKDTQYIPACIGTIKHLLLISRVINVKGNIYRQYIKGFIHNNKIKDVLYKGLSHNILPKI